MDPRSKISLAAAAGEFTTTHWSVVLRAGDAGSPLASEALEQLCRSYWFPLYVYVRRQGFPPHEAQDVTQGFFHQLIEKTFLKEVDPAKGRFRSFLLAAIKHFIFNARKYERRLKRGGGQIIVPLDTNEAEARYSSEPTVDSTPDRAFDRRWALTLMELGLQRLRLEYVEAGKERLFGAMKKFVSVEPAPGEYESLGQDLGLSKNAMGVAVHRLRHRYGELIREEIASTVAQPGDVEDEMRYLLRLLSGT